jgi:hypothetical protein
MSTVQPKAVQKAAVRFAIGLLLIAAFLAGYNFLRTYGQDLNNLGSTDTSGWIAAIREEPEGSRLVVIKPDGTVVESPGYREGASDRDFAWRPDGNQIIFTSNRRDGSYQLYRWNLANGSVEQRTTGTRNFANPRYSGDAGGPLVTSGGFVAEFDPVKMATTQVLPPTGREIALGNDEGSGGTGQFDALYSKIGSSFKEARYTADRSKIVAVMRRDIGEVLMIQQMVPDKNGKVPPPGIIAAGEAVHFDLSPTSNVVVYSIINFEWPDLDNIPEDFRKGGRVSRPFRHGIGIANLDNPQEPESNGLVASSNDDKLAFGPVRLAPDGSSFLVMTGSYEDGSRARAVLNVPAKPNGAVAASRVVQGNVLDFSWSADGKRVAYIVSEGGKRSLRTVGVDGGGEQKILDGDFLRAAFSPQAAK